MSEKENPRLVIAQETGFFKFEEQCNELLDKGYYLAFVGRGSPHPETKLPPTLDMFWAIFVNDKNLLASNR